MQPDREGTKQNGDENARNQHDDAVCIPVSQPAIAKRQNSRLEDHHGRRSDCVEPRRACERVVE